VAVKKKKKRNRKKKERKKKKGRKVAGNTRDARARNRAKGISKTAEIDGLLLARLEVPQLSHCRQNADASIDR
jgi:hypothetical protein